MNKYLFRYGFVNGKEIFYRIAITGSVDITAPGGSMSNPVKIDMYISQKIISCDEEQAVVRVRIDNVVADPRMSKEHLPKIGVDSIMQIDRVGNVRWMDGAAAWQGAEHSMMRFPEEPLEPGDSWVQQVEDVSGSATPFHTRYRFNGFDRKNRQLMVFATEMFTAHPDDPESESMGRGTFSFDLEENWIHETSNRIVYSYRIPVPENPALKIETKTTLNIDMERLKK
ncbi:MAG: hypothetical protein PHD82_04650 [Candidatus Riflebacteria bacterium]|jgi:hypothetical protein|nr:hypothetical protein [Candidatus Riflebacteria bacterium]